MAKTSKLTKKQISVIWIMTFGGVLEWYDIYSFIYLAPILGRLFFNFQSSSSNLLGALLLFSTSFISRPFGSIVFGRIGDLIGRKTAFMYSIFFTAIITFLMGCLPTHALAGNWAPTLFFLLRFIQAIPTAAEIPGTICFLYENASLNNRNYMSSWTYIGNQIGAILGLFETVIMDSFISETSMLLWGWRVTFWFGGLLGFFGYYLRRNLNETPIFKSLKSHHHLDKETVVEVINNHKKPILFGICLGAINASTFYLFATYIPELVVNILPINSLTITWIMIAILVFTTAIIPLFGKLAEKFSSKKLLIYSSMSVILLLLPLYFSITNGNITSLFILGIIYALPIACISALYPYWIAHIFHPNIRYTAVGLSFNFADALIGSFAPAIALIMFQLSNKHGTFCLYVLLCSIVSVIAYINMKQPRTKA